MSNTSTIRIMLSIILGIMFIAAGIIGHPGSILGALIDAADMEKTG